MINEHEDCTPLNGPIIIDHHQPMGREVGIGSVSTPLRSAAVGMRTARGETYVHGDVTLCWWVGVVGGGGAYMVCIGRTHSSPRYIGKLCTNVSSRVVEPMAQLDTT